MESSWAFTRPRLYLRTFAALACLTTLVIALGLEMDANQKRESAEDSANAAATKIMNTTTKKIKLPDLPRELWIADTAIELGLPPATVGIALRLMSDNRKMAREYLETYPGRKKK